MRWFTTTAVLISIPKEPVPRSPTRWRWCQRSLAKSKLQSKKGKMKVRPWQFFFSFIVLGSGFVRFRDRKSASKVETSDSNESSNRQELAISKFFKALESDSGHSCHLQMRPLIHSTTKQDHLNFYFARKRFFVGMTLPYWMCIFPISQFALNCSH